MQCIWPLNNYEDQNFDGHWNYRSMLLRLFYLTARHKYRGALLQGDDLLSTALYILFVFITFDLIPTTLK